MVSHKTSQKVIEAVSQRRLLSRRLANSHLVIGISAFFPADRLRNPYMTEIMAGIHEAGYDQGFRIQVVDVMTQRNFGESYLQFVDRLELDGIIYIAPDDRTMASIEEMAGMGVTQFVIGSSFENPSIGWVDSENVKSSKGAIDYLLNIGHRQIAIITADQGLPDQRERLEGYRLAMRAAGIDTEMGLARQNLSPDNSISYTKELLAENPEVTAIFYTCETMAIGGMKACMEMGLNIPGDVSIVTFADSSLPNYSIPAITHLFQPAFEMGKIAAREITAAIKHPEKKMRQARISPDFYIYGSTGRPRQHLPNP
jgi:LacI family transcriptional regulator